MAVRCLRSKLSERIFTHVLEDARIMPHRLVKGLPPLASEGSKIAPLARHSAIGSTMPIKNRMFQSCKSVKVPERIPFAFLPNAKNVLCNEAGYNLSTSLKVPERIPLGFLPNAMNVLSKESGNPSSSFKGKSDPILIHGRRNFSSWSPGTGTKNTHEMDLGNKGSGTEKIYQVKVDRSMSRKELLMKIIKVYAAVFVSVNFVAFYYTVWDTLCSSPFLFFFTVGGHILCFLFMLMGVLN